MYCVKCKIKTKTKNLKHTTTKNRRLMLQGKCVQCGITKSQFLSGTCSGYGTKKKLSMDR